MNRFFIFFCFFLITSFGHARAESTCSYDTWNILVNQGLIQAQRENIMNQRYITKPDSVLEYTCFDELLRVVGEDTGRIFSMSDFWVNKDTVLRNGSTVITLTTSLNSDSLLNALSAAVIQSLEAYVSMGFWHEYLASTSPDTTISDGPCNAMAAVWSASQCQNIDGIGNEIYYPIHSIKPAEDARKADGTDVGKVIGYADVEENETLSDLRIFPPTMECSNTAILTRAANDNRDLNQMPNLFFPPSVQTSRNMNEAAPFSVPEMFTEFLAPEDLEPAEDCASVQPIMTGLTIKQTETEFQGGQTNVKDVTYPDGFCLPVGCTLDKQSFTNTDPNSPPIPTCVSVSLDNQ